MRFAADHRHVETARGREFAGLARTLFGNVRLDFGAADEEKSAMLSAMLGACRLTRLEADRHVVFGERVTAGPEYPDAIKLILQTAGSASIEQSGVQAPVAANALVIYDPRRPYVLTNSTPVRQLLLQMPRQALPQAAVERLAAPFTAHAGQDGMCGILLSLMESTMQEIGHLDEARRSSVGQTMIDFVRTMIGEGRPQRLVADPLDLLLARIKAFIACNIARPDLTVAMIARRMSCSVRYVYRAFEAERLTPSDYIWDLRLQLAAGKLREAGGHSGEISGIAFALGFSSSAHFSRAFRTRYAVSPSQWRKAALS
ncbi:AraC family transcriptional regulator protein (plasmid) [Rhizobium phaseoli]|uniref:AraC-like ligand-binding domain-containing protein n=1 Tax=Rhizobium phaseoli TaxID=396 RepID=UPI0007E9D813|nr:helix-turn-helix domain-containing protein [Rhizobium phaseoli]ANL69821.1 AraC family transcriptional regulator protein [Rhizobium phaseoli]ANL76258.1 AraC family transcriptional regulator protein [Rhizobium phaseoli]ANL82615.1 AraC family transcriptional regulator protein [Rhizobium phaseoli]PDS68712.1 AraC family transcriptional regulator [Rhizobium phaseoli]